jgi:hypothetical protein
MSDGLQAKYGLTMYDACLSLFDAMGAYLVISMAALRAGFRLAALESPS